MRELLCTQHRTGSTRADLPLKGKTIAKALLERE
jgi:hypothetical protein